MPAPASVLALVKRFGEQIDAYKSGDYKEHQVRVEFIDPFFKALGWDMHNESGAAPAYQDVIHEDAIKIGFQTKAPDYCFRIGGTRKFFLEAKKPAVNIKDDIGPAFQVRRYAWSSKLSLSIVTDFEEFAVYDCRIRPQKNDKPSVGRVFYCRFEEYEQKWDEIAGIFSKEAILKGSFDKFADSSKKKKGTAEVDDAFLEEIESWREGLAKNIALRNPKLSVRELNFSVQQTIDRIIFLRICEDRGIEPYGRLQGLLNGTNIYKRLTDLFRTADDRYNSGLFHFKEDKDRPAEPDGLTLSLKIDDDAIQDVLKNLYYPDSPYEFSVLPADILGQVYEQFLGKVIRLTDGHRAKVEEKPEVRKAGGVYYTPKYIVDYIVKNTIGKLVDGKEPKEVAKLHILDPACGSGSFLIQAYQFLLDWHRDWYANHEPEQHAKGKNAAVFHSPAGEWRLTTKERKRILLNNIYGVDIDSQAVEVTKLSLLLKVLEGESPQSLTQNLEMFHERVLPDLQNNIKCGNSLVAHDFYQGSQLTLLDDEERLRINAFDWQDEFAAIFKGKGFDSVVGNPPYSTVTDESFKGYFERTYRTTEGRFDTYELFIEQGLRLIKPSGYLGYIVPSPLLTNLYTRKLRSFLKSEFCIDEITNFGMDVFQDPTVHTCIFVIQKLSPKDNVVSIRKQITDARQLNEPYDYEVPQAELGQNETSSFDVFIDPANKSIFEKLAARSRALGEICFIRQCIKTGDDEKYVRVSDKTLDAPWKPSLRGKSIARYMTLEKNVYLSYGSWLARNWQNKSFYETPKIAIRETGNRLTATLDLEDRYFLSSLYAIYPKPGYEVARLKYLLAIINSKLATYYMHKTALALTAGAFTKVRTNQLARLPIRELDLTNPVQSAAFEKINSLVTTLISLNESLNDARLNEEKESRVRQARSIDSGIDKLVYELYGLSDAEITFIESEIH